MRGMTKRAVELPGMGIMDIRFESASPDGEVVRAFRRAFVNSMALQTGRLRGGRGGLIRKMAGATGEVGLGVFAGDAPMRGFRFFRCFPRLLRHRRQGKQ